MNYINYELRDINLVQKENGLQYVYKIKILNTDYKKIVYDEKIIKDIAFKIVIEYFNNHVLELKVDDDIEINIDQATIFFNQIVENFVEDIYQYLINFINFINQENTQEAQERNEIFKIFKEYNDHCIKELFEEFDTIKLIKKSKKIKNKIKQNKLNNKLNK
jgi:hypothetical protein